MTSWSAFSVKLREIYYQGIKCLPQNLAFLSMRLSCDECYTVITHVATFKSTPFILVSFSFLLDALIELQHNHRATHQEPAGYRE